MAIFSRISVEPAAAAAAAVFRQARDQGLSLDVESLASQGTHEQPAEEAPSGAPPPAGAPPAAPAAVSAPTKTPWITIQSIPARLVLIGLLAAFAWILSTLLYVTNHDGPGLAFLTIGEGIAVGGLGIKLGEHTGVSELKDTLGLG